MIDPYEQTARALADISRKEVAGPWTDAMARRLARASELIFDTPEEQAMVVDALMPDTPAARALRRHIIGKDSTKRNLSEKTISRRIDEIVARLNITGIPATGGKLPGSGEGSLFVQNGAVVTRQQKSASNRTKSLDFFISAMGQRILIPAKYTVGDGGAQDNQRIDLHGVIAAAANLQAPDALIAVADGSHYSKPGPPGPPTSRTSRFTPQPAALASGSVSTLISSTMSTGCSVSKRLRDAVEPARFRLISHERTSSEIRGGANVPDKARSWPVFYQEESVRSSRVYRLGGRG